MVLGPKDGFLDAELFVVVKKRKSLSQSVLPLDLEKKVDNCKAETLNSKPRPWSDIP